MNGARCGFQSRDDGSIGQDKSEFWCDIDDVRVAIVVGVDRRHIQGRKTRHPSDREVGSIYGERRTLANESHVTK